MIFDELSKMKPQMESSPAREWVKTSKDLRYDPLSYITAWSYNSLQKKKYGKKKEKNPDLLLVSAIM